MQNNKKKGTGIGLLYVYYNGDSNNVYMINKKTVNLIKRSICVSDENGMCCTRKKHNKITEGSYIVDPRTSHTSKVSYPRGLKIKRILIGTRKGATKPEIMVQFKGSAQPIMLDKIADSNGNVKVICESCGRLSEIVNINFAGTR